MDGCVDWIGASGEEELPSGRVGVDASPDKIPDSWVALPLVQENRFR